MSSKTLLLTEKNDGVNNIKQTSEDVNSVSKNNYYSCENPPVENTYNQHLVTRNYAGTTAALCLCNLTQAYLLLSVFPYAGYMTIHLVPDINKENAGIKAGFIASSFMLGRMLSSFHWGKIADIYGRKATLIVSLFLSAIFSFIFGLSTSFEYALISRLFLGISNAIVGIVKTVVTEMAHGNETLEAKSTGIVIGMRSWGFLIAPALGGFLADPLKQYPKSSLVHRFESFLSTYPFAIPNILGTCLCVGSMLITTLYVEETLPADKLRSFYQMPQDLLSYMSFFCEHCPCWEKSPSRIQDTLSSAMVIDEERDANAIKMFWSNKRIRLLLMTYWIHSFIVAGIDEVFPLFCLATSAGLGLSEISIGKILGSSGILFAMFQYIVFQTILSNFGLLSTLKIGVKANIMSILLIPISLTLNGRGNLGTISFPTFMFLSVVMAIQKIFSCMFFATITIATNKTVLIEYRGTLNGVSMVGASLSKALGPTAFGFTLASLISSGSVPPLLGTCVTFILLSSFGIIILIFLADLSFDSDKHSPENV